MAEQGSGMGKWVVGLVGCLGLLFVGASGLCCGVPWVGGRVMNAGPVSLSEVDGSWTIRSHTGSAVAVATALQTGCTPMGNGLRVIFQELWYNAMTSGYDLTLWLEGPEGSYDSYALYVSGHAVYLRDEVSAGGYHNQVLVCALDASGFEALASP